MKTCCLLPEALGLSISVYAQFRDTVYVIPKRDENKVKSYAPVTPGAKLLSVNKLGNFFNLSLDNMQSLVPNLENIIPIPNKSWISKMENPR